MKYTLAALFAQALVLAPAGAWAQDPAGYVAPFSDVLESRVFPLPAMLRAAAGWREALAADPALRELARRRAARVPALDCAPAPACLADAWMWTDDDIVQVEARLRAIAAREPRLARALVTGQMRASGRFARHAALDDAGMLAAAWRETAAGMNRVIAVYAKGEPPRYPRIDAAIFDVADAEYGNLLKTHAVATVAFARADDLFLDPALRYAVGLLENNERTDAGTFRPLLDGENAAPRKAAATMRWQDHAWPALLVFGHGTEDPVSRTGVMGQIRLRLAADMFRRGLAPFIVVSGGNVHPNRTPYNEAVEMKRLLVERHGVPAERVFIEPHARHTTTNLRNCARLLLAAGFPADRPSLIVSDHMTIQYIAGRELAERNVREMGIQPGRVEAGPDRFTARFTPNAAAFHVEVADPLDP